MKIGFIGLGIMGSGMAARLIEAEFDLIVHNRGREKADRLLGVGATWAESPAAVGTQAEILFTMLAHPEAVEVVALGEKGFFQTLKPNSLWVDCSTVNPSFSHRMAAEATKREIAFLDAPVAGSRKPAQEGTLTFFVGGDSADFQRCQPLLDVMGSRTVHVGDHGMGTSLKMVFNMILAANTAIFSEGLVLGRSLGLSLDFLFDLLLATPMVPPYMATKRERITSGEFAPDFPLRLMHKDMHLATKTGYETGVALPVANAAKELYGLAASSGLGEQDFSAIFSFLEKADIDRK